MKHEARTQTLGLIADTLALVGEQIDDYEVWQAIPCPCMLCGEVLADTTYFIDDMSEPASSSAFAVRADGRKPIVNETAKRGLFCETHGLLGFHKEGRYYSTVSGELVSASTPAALAKAVAA